MRIFAGRTMTPCRSRLVEIFRRIHLGKMPKDTVEFASDKSVSSFKHIKHKTAEKFLNTQFTPSDKDYGDYAYRTFVFNKETGEPVEMIVCPKILDNFDEEYYILNPNKVANKTKRKSVSDLIYVKLSRFIRYDKTKEMTVAGGRSFSYDSKTKEILSGAMTSYEREDYSGLGLREHQIAIERMLMNKCPELNISAIPSAYKFHKDCGFEVVKHNIYLDEREFQGKINEYTRRLDLDESTIKSMLVYRRKRNGCYLLDENSTFEKFVNYLSANNRALTGLNYFSIDMRLTKEALKEWKQIIEKNPIFIGKKFPEIS